jgi:hypothetical protein
VVSQYTTIPGWSIVGLLGFSAALVLCRVLLRNTIGLLAFLFCVTVAAALAVARVWPASDGAIQGLAQTCAAAALLWAVFAALARPHADRATDDRWSDRFARLARVVALLLAIPAVIVLAVILTMRTVLVAVELVTLVPHPATYRYGFGVDGLWTLLFVFLSSTVAWVSTRDRRLAVCQLWGAISLALWICLLNAPLRTTAVGGVERTSLTLFLAVVVAATLALAVLVIGRVHRLQSPCSVQTSTDPTTDQTGAWPGLTLSVTAIATGMLLLVCYHLAIPLQTHPGGHRLSAFILAGTAGVTASTCFGLSRQALSVPLLDSAMASTSIGLCALATIIVPEQPHALAARYPMLFNAMIVGLAVAMALCVSIGTEPPGPPAAWRGSAFITRLMPHARRFAFLDAALALVVSFAMALWPRWPEIPIMDDSFGRMTAGCAANLLLLLVALWASRRIPRVSYQVLTVLVLVSTTAFLVIRLLPFSARFG